MILKNDLKNFDFSIKDSQSNVGLREGDSWCLVHVFFQSNEGDFDFLKNALSKGEIRDLLIVLNDFLNCQTYFRKRISFIKNYFVFYLENGYKNNKVLKIKFVNVDGNRNNYFLTLYLDDIKKIIHVLESFQDEITSL